MASKHETLEDHLNSCMCFLQKLFIARGFHRHIAYVSNMPDSEASVALKTTILFHDYGKAALEYQTAGKLSFPKHEYFSTAVAFKALMETKWKTEALTAIVWHHMAMPGPNITTDMSLSQRRESVKDDAT